MAVSTPATWSRIDEDTSAAVRVADEIRAMGDDAVRKEIEHRLAHTSAELAAEREAERMAWAHEQAARLRVTV